MIKSKNKIATDQIIDRLSFDPEQHNLSATKTLQIAKSYIDDYKISEREQIIDAFCAGAEFGKKAPDQIKLLAELYFSIRFDNKL